MVWGKVDDRLHRHRKARKAGLSAMGLWVMGLSFCVDQRTDGRIEWDDIRSLSDEDPRRVRGHIRRLVDVGMWVEIGPGSWEYHDWLDYQPSSVHVTEKSKKSSAAARAKWSKYACETHAKRNAERNADRLPRARDPDPDPDPVDHTSYDQLGTVNRSEPDAVVRRVRTPDPDLPPESLSPAERAAFAAIADDPTLRPIVQKPARVARDLVSAGPAVDVALEIRRAGAWLRANPSKQKRNGARFLLSWITRTQERGGNKGQVGPVRAVQQDLELIDVAEIRRQFYERGNR